MPAPLFREKLICAESGFRRESFDLDGRRVTPDCPILWSIRLRTLHGGKQEGAQILEIDAGSWRMNLLPTRGLGILDVEAGDLRLGWNSPVREVVNPAFVSLERRGGTGWLEGFNEFLVRCGLEWFGPPVQDAFHGARAEPPGGPLTLHGKIANVPASKLEVVVERDRGGPKVRVIGEVAEASMYGPKFTLKNEIQFRPGDLQFTVEDTVTNRAGQAQEWGLLYHINQGAPLLEDGAGWAAPVRWLAPRDEESAAHAKRLFRYSGPRPGCLEQAFLGRLHGDSAGQTLVAMHNRAKSLGVSIGWSLKKLPYFTCWKAEHAEADGYVTGLEPGTNWPLARPLEREAGRVPVLRPGASQTHALTIGLLRGRAEVTGALAQIRKIAGRKPAKILPKPADFTRSL